ncbi:MULTISPECIES: GlxA family transcriptional regulator [unclassified Cedecea]|uniref:GlxA family transcriptional regulator n=1 Tax=unclassified Cedecea TaxID=2649846 RepID=UPI00301B6716
MQKVGFVVTPGYSTMGFAVITAFEVANLMASEPVYELHLLSEQGGGVPTSAGFEVMTEPMADTQYDLLLFGATMEQASPATIDFVRQAAVYARRVAAACLGTFLLAEAGLLEGRRATTHWMYARDLQQRFPGISVEEDKIFICDGPYWTSAGMTAAIDLALALIEDDLGADIARTIARKLVLYHRRAGGQSQFSSLLELEPKSDRIQKVMTYARAHLENALSVEELAAVANLSPRQFSRSFQAETGQSPARAIEHLRLESARMLLETSARSIDEVARQTGFGERDRMRRAFLRAYGQPPQVIRRQARGDEELQA